VRRGEVGCVRAARVCVRSFTCASMIGCECRHVGPTSEPADASVLSGFRAQGDESVPSRGLLDLGNRVSERASERDRERKRVRDSSGTRTRERVNKTASERASETANENASENRAGGERASDRANKTASTRQPAERHARVLGRAGVRRKTETGDEKRRGFFFSFAEMEKE